MAAQVWDLGRGFCTSTLICHSSVNSVRLTMDGFAAVSGHFDGALRFWDLRSGKLANEVAGLHTQQITSISIGLRTGGNRATNTASTQYFDGIQDGGCILPPLFTPYAAVIRPLGHLSPWI